MAVSKESVPFPIVEKDMIPQELLSLVGNPEQVEHALSGLNEEVQTPSHERKFLIPLK